jgi:hypothetical protein
MDEGNVERNLGRVLAKLEDIQRRMDHADDSRSSIHEGMNSIVLRVSHIEADLTTVKRKVEGVEQVTEDVKKMRERAFGAGTFGVWLWRVGGVVISFAAGLAAAYTWLTGRPPP